MHQASEGQNIPPPTLSHPPPTAKPTAAAAEGLKPIPFVRGLPLVGSLWSFQNARLAFLEKVARECGEIGSFRLGPFRMLLANSARLVHAILVEHADTFGLGKKADIGKPVVGPNSLAVIDGEYHRAQRRLNAPAFQYKRVLEYSSSMADFADALQRGWRDGEEVDLKLAMGRLTQRIIQKTLFNIDNASNTEEFTAALKIAEQYMEYLSSSILPVPLRAPSARNRKTRGAIATMRRIVTELITERRRSQVDHGDFLSMLLLAQENGVQLNDEQVLDHALTMYIAGHETSATALTWAFLLIAAHPEVAARLRQEIDSVLQGAKPTYSDLIRLPYALRVLKETLRIRCPPYMSGRAPSRDIDILGYRFRKGEYTLISQHTLHRDPQHFPDPERFDPERFSPENEKLLPRGAFLPFGVGPHSCIGAQFAMMEMHMILAHLMQHVELSLSPGQEIRPVPLLVVQPNSSRMIVRRRTQV